MVWRGELDWRPEGSDLHIAIVCHPTQGGSGVVAVELAHELARRGHQAHVISYRAPLRLRPSEPNVRFHEVGLPSHPLLVHAPYAMALADKIGEVARYEGIDLVHVHYAVPHAFAAVTARAMSGHLPVVTTLHGTDVTQLGADATIAAALAWSVESSDAVTAVSEHLAGMARVRFPRANIRTIPNFIDPVVLRRRQPRRTGGELVLLHASNFRPVKRIGDVLAVFAGVAAVRPARLLLLGDGPEIGAAHRQASELRVADRVQFLGLQEDVWPHLAAADIFLLPSEQESFGLAALEAMACEVPVVATRTGGLPEVVADGEAGFLRPVGDVVGMTEACLRLGDPQVRARMGAAARRRAIGRFAASRVVPRYEALYREVLGNRA